MTAEKPDRDWFMRVDSVCSLVGHRRYGLTDDRLAADLIAISQEARQFAEADDEEGTTS